MARTLDDYESRIGRKLGKLQNQFLTELIVSSIPLTEKLQHTQLFRSLTERELIQVINGQVHITEDGRTALAQPINQANNRSLFDDEEGTEESRDLTYEKLKKKEIMFLAFLKEKSYPLGQILKAKHILPNLHQRELVESIEGEIRITPKGLMILEQEFKRTAVSYNSEELVRTFFSFAKVESKGRLLNKSNELLALYKQELTYQEIGDRYHISRERVRQYLELNPAFHEYLKEREAAKIAAEKEKEEQARRRFEERTLAAQYPARIAELWDYEKNGRLKPEDVPVSSASHEIWLKCPKDEFSWKKKAREIAFYSWERAGTSGCPKCAGKSKKPEKQPLLTDSYFEYVVEYWNFEKNESLDLDPEILTIGSNKQAWFKCPKDGNEWKSIIAATIKQQWSKGNAGCRVCNGTHLRKNGAWGKAGTLMEQFPNEVSKYWDYAKNSLKKLDPSKITSGASKEAYFKCPNDGYEWQANISRIVNSSWKKGNSGCPACSGRIVTDKSALTVLYPELVSQYWDFEKNGELGLSPSQLTRGVRNEVWFKCPIDNFEWQARIADIIGSWKIGNNGCPRCGQGWTNKAIRHFVSSLEKHIPNLTQSERYKIFEQAGILGTNNSESLKIVNDIIKGKLTGQKLRDVIQGKKVEVQENTDDIATGLDANAELHNVNGYAKNTNSPHFYNESTAPDRIDEEPSDLPTIRVQKSLEFLSSKIVASSDDEAIEFFIASRRNRIWAEVFEDQAAVEGLVNFSDDGYGRQVRDQFLDEYNQANNMQIPSGWAFRVDGKVTPPNLMQKVAAVRLRTQKRMLNLSLTGTGKTIGGILGSRIIDAKLTVIICPLDTIKNWHGEIKHVFPDSVVTTKSFNPFWINIDSGHHYIILNHEMFQQPSTASDIRQLLECYKIDLIVVDEIHRCKQRSDDPSKRRQMVLALITNAAEINPDLHVLGMSATPIINNLREGKSLVELVSGIERADLGEKATINNCMKLHQSFVSLGIRSRVKPKIRIERVIIPVDCTDLVDEIRENGTSVLKMEQILTSARIPTILAEIRPKTIVYTHYVEGIVEQLKDAIEADGWTVGFHVGGDKSGRESFINGSTDVLIASSAMAVGVDGFQKVCDRLILNIPPWTSAELEQLEGRLNRQGQVHESLTIIFPVTFGEDGDERWSWDEGRLARLQNKQTIADAAVDGVMPEGQLRTESQAFRDLRSWLDRLNVGEQRSIVRPKIFVPLPESDVVDVKRRNIKYGDFSRMNARWNSSYSATTYQRLQKNPEEWMQYHTLYQGARKT